MNDLAGGNATRVPGFSYDISFGDLGPPFNPVVTSFTKLLASRCFDAVVNTAYSSICIVFSIRREVNRYIGLECSDPVV